MKQASVDGQRRQVGPQKPVRGVSEPPARQRILLAERSDELRQRLAALLDERGLLIEQAADGIDAITRLGLLVDRPPDIVLLHVSLPRLDGFQVCALLRHCQRFQQLRLVLVSDQDCLVERCRAQMAGADELLSAPFSSEELLRALAVTIADGKR